MSADKKVLVLGVGNLLFTDEGIGVKAVNTLQEKYKFKENVQLLEGGTLGMELMDSIMGCDFLIVLDAVLGDGPAGSIYRLSGDDLRKSLAFKNSMHQTDLVDTLIYCDLAGHRPEAVIIGMEPHDYSTMSIELSTAAQENMPAMLDKALEEIESIAPGSVVS